MRDYLRDWASYEPGSIPTKSDVPELEVFLSEMERRARLLDLGCGSGRISRMLAERGFDVTAVDINEMALASAEGGGVSFHVRDIASREGLRLGGPEFQIVVCQLVISVVGGLDERETLLRNAFDVLEPGGWLYLSASEVSDDVNPGYAKLYRDDFAETRERYSYFSRDGSGNILYMTHHFTGPELTALVEGAGLALHRLTSKTEASSRRPDEAAHFLYVVARKPSSSEMTGG